MIDLRASASSSDIRTSYFAATFVPAGGSAYKPRSFGIGAGVTQMLLGEPIGWNLIIGLIAVAAGIWLASTSSSRLGGA